MFRACALFRLLAATLSLTACSFSSGGQRFEGGGVTIVAPIQKSSTINGPTGIEYTSSSLIALTDGHSLVVNASLYGSLQKGDVVDLTQPGVVKVNGIPRAAMSRARITGTWTLPSGHPVKVLGTEALISSVFNSPCLAIFYQTDLPISDVPALEKQADQVLDRFKPMLEKAQVGCGYARAVDALDSSGVSRSQQSFLYIRFRGAWSRIPQ
jgi:hypothetical protein